MKIKGLLLWSIFIIVVGVILGSSTWHQWSANQETVIERMKPIPPTAAFPHGSPIRTIVFDPKNPKLIASAGSGHIVKVWNTNIQDKPQLTLKTHQDKDRSTDVVGLAFSPTDNWIAVKIYWKLEVWNTVSGDRINTLHIPSAQFATSYTGNHITMASKELKVWNISDPNNITAKFMLPPRKGWESVSLNRLQRTITTAERSFLHHDVPDEYIEALHNQDYYAIHFSHDGKLIAAALKTLYNNQNNSADNVAVWDLESKDLLYIIERGILDYKRPFQGHRDIRSISFSPNNRFIAVAAYNGFTIWTLPDWAIYHHVIDQQIRDIAFSPDGTMFAVCNVKGITLWSIKTLTPVALLAGGGLFRSNVIEFSPDGTTLAGGGYRGVLQIWDMKDIHEE